MPLKDDYGILRILRSTKAAYDKLRGRKRLTVEEKMPLVEEMTSSTLDLAPKDWKKFINEDRSLSASWRREKIQYLEDFIGTSATRTARLKDLSFVKQMALEVEWESREKEGEGVSSHSSPSPSSSSSSNRNRDETNSSRGRPRKIQRMDEEGEGGEETEGEEDGASNDNDVDYQPPSRKKSRGGGDDGDDGGIACSVPRDLLRRLTPLAEKMGWSMRDQLLAAVGVYEIHML